MTKPMLSYSPRERAQQLAWLGQHDTAGDDLSVYDVVMLGRLPHQHWWNGASAQDRQVVEAINAIIKGRTGTSSDQYAKTDGTYLKGKKRK